MVILCDSLDGCTLNLCDSLDECTVNLCDSLDECTVNLCGSLDECTVILCNCHSGCNDKRDSGNCPAAPQEEMVRRDREMVQVGAANHDCLGNELPDCSVLVAGTFELKMRNRRCR